MLLSRRRLLLSAILAGTFFFLFSRYKDPVQHFRKNGGTTATHDWGSVKERYPVKSMTPLPSGKPKALPKIQYDFSSASSSTTLSKQESRRDTIKETFTRGWKSYKKRAWMQDELAPISGGSVNTFSGWAATLVDNLDTLWMMDMKDDFYEAVRALSEIDFTWTEDDKINVFETTIRYLGGFLAAYDLSGDQALLDKAVEVGNMLYIAFDTPNRMPITRWDMKNGLNGGEQHANRRCLVAEVGSLTLEFTRLSQLTGNPKWFDAVNRVMHVFEEQQNKTDLPGMWPIMIDAYTPDFTDDSTFTLGGMADSLYEYFPKTYALLGGLDDMYQRLYEFSMATAVKHNIYRPMVPDNADILISGRSSVYSSRINLIPEGQHLVCFAGGMFALGAKLFNMPEHMDIARKLVDGCIWAYNATPSGIMPEIFRMIPCQRPDDGSNKPLSEACEWDEAKYQEALLGPGSSRAQADETRRLVERNKLPKGFVGMEDRQYLLRPEAIESVFLLYRMTGDESLLDAAWDMFTAIDEMTSTEYGNAVLADVTTARDANAEEPPRLKDKMESFWLAETLKYFYLIFSDPQLISLDEYVFNTEAHPLKRPS